MTSDISLREGQLRSEYEEAKQASQAAKDALDAHCALRRNPPYAGFRGTYSQRRLELERDRSEAYRNETHAKFRMLGIPPTEEGLRLFFAETESLESEALDIETLDMDALKALESEALEPKIEALREGVRQRSAAILRSYEQRWSGAHFYFGADIHEGHKLVGQVKALDPELRSKLFAAEKPLEVPDFSPCLPPESAEQAANRKAYTDAAAEARHLSYEYSRVLDEALSSGGSWADPEVTAAREAALEATHKEVRLRRDIFGGSQDVQESTTG